MKCPMCKSENMDAEYPSDGKIDSIDSLYIHLKNYHNYEDMARFIAYHLKSFAP